MRNKISGVYKITNIITNECYVGSSADVYKRWREHKCKSSWNQRPNSKLYQAMQKYGLDKFKFEIIVPAAPTHLKVCEQEFINIYKPAYNNYNAKGRNISRRSLTNNRFNKIYRVRNRDKLNKYQNAYMNRICIYNGEELSLRALHLRLYKCGVVHPMSVARKYIKGE